MEQILKRTNVPPVVLSTPLNTTTRANIAITGISDVTIFKSGLAGTAAGSRIFIAVSSFFILILVFLTNLGYSVVAIRSLYFLILFVWILS